MTKKEVSNNEIMQALGRFAASVDARFDAIDGRFEGVDEKFEGIDARFDRIDMRLFKIENHLDNLENDMTEVKSKIDRMYGILDEHMRRIESIMIMQENQVQKYQQERLERWIFQLADQMNVKLKYE